MSLGPYEDVVPVPRWALRFPLELPPPPGFRPEDLSTWPHFPGRLEFVGGRLLFMPPCGDVQQDVAASLVAVVEPWTRSESGFVVGSDEAGMLLGGEVRGAELAVWRKDTLPRTGGVRRVAPLLASEVAGIDDTEVLLREKAQWYLAHGVRVVWLVLPEAREVIVIEPGNERRFSRGQRLPPHAEMPGLEPKVDEIFWQLDH